MKSFGIESPTRFKFGRQRKVGHYGIKKPTTDKKTLNAIYKRPLLLSEKNGLASGHFAYVLDPVIFSCDPHLYRENWGGCATKGNISLALPNISIEFEMAACRISRASNNFIIST